MVRASRFSRRALLKGLAATAVAAIGSRAVYRLAGAETRAATAPPRYWLQIVPGGGLDAVLTTDPRTRSQVKAGVDVPYPASKIVDAGPFQLGPTFADLARHADNLAIVNGILVKAANHYTGMEQLTRLRTSTTPRTPSCVDIIGAHRDSQAVGHVILNAIFREARTLGALSDPVGDVFGGDAEAAGHPDGLFGVLDQLSAQELADLAEVMRREASSLQRAGSLDYKRQCALDSFEQSRALFERYAAAPRFSPEPWPVAEKVAKASKLLGLPPALQRALWLFENDLAATVTVFANGQAWDTHWDNLALQTNYNGALTMAVSHTLDQLQRRSNRHGKLAELTAVMIGSEIGRFPYVNANAGKDHFPQVPLVCSGPAFRCGRALGAVGKELEALPTSVDTGAEQPGGSRLLLDDVGATALRIAGLDPRSYGVAGRDLRFLRAGG